MRTRRTLWLVIGIVMLVLIACQPDRGNTIAGLDSNIATRV